MTKKKNAPRKKQKKGTKAKQVRREATEQLDDGNQDQPKKQVAIDENGRKMTVIMGREAVWLASQLPTYLIVWKLRKLTSIIAGDGQGLGPHADDLCHSISVQHDLRKARGRPRSRQHPADGKKYEAGNLPEGEGGS